MKVTDYEKECLSKCNFGDKRLTARALYIQISEVFKEVQNLDNCGVVVRATHNRSLKDEGDYLWDYMKKQPLQFSKKIELPSTEKRKK